MKKLSLISMVVAMAVTLSACGGGSATGGSSTNVTQASSNSDELILNSGRGTVNNQDTEHSD